MFLNTGVNYLFSYSLQKMIQPKPNFVDRVEQSIVHLKNNLLSIALPITIFNILFLIVIPTIMSWVIPLEQLTSWDISQKMPMLISLWVTILFVYIIVFLLFMIPIQIAMVKTIKETLIGNKISIADSISYGCKNILQAFKTYWYIFAYVYLIPALLFIVWWLIFIIATMLSSSLQSQVMMLWSAIMGISILLSIVFAIYKWTKSTFWLISAVDKEEFTKDNFHSSVSLSDTKWWRVFWNLFWIWFIVGCVINLVSFVIWLINIFSSDLSSLTENLWEWEEGAGMQEIIAEFTNFNLWNFISDIISTWFWSILWTLIVVFSYIFFMRLRHESQQEWVVKKEIEL